MNRNKDSSTVPPRQQNVYLPAEFVGRIETPHGVQHVYRGAALDHAYMRSKQLSSLLLAISGEGLSHFSCLNESARDSLLWLAKQLADETEAMFDIVLADQIGGAA
jgi:hypothetical protein